MVTVEEFDNESDPLGEALANKGISPKFLAMRLKQELNAQVQKVFNDKEDGIVYSDKLIDWNTRQKARMDAHKLMGHYPAEKHDVKHSGVVGLKQLLDDIDGESKGPSGEECQSD